MTQRFNRWWQQWMIASDEMCTRAGEAFDVSPSTGRRKLALQLSQLEPRLLFSATPLDVAAMAGADAGGEMEMAAEVAVAESGADSIQTLAESSSADQTAHEIVFIDSAVPDLQQLLDDLSDSGRNLEVFVLDADRDGIDQITEVLDSRTDVSSIHIVSHAENGSVKLGNVWLGESNLDGYAGQLAAWQSSMTTNADILLYGCDLAETPSGQIFLDSVSALTGADVAASTDDTGHASFEADWDLEYATGSIETSVAFSAELQENWLGKLATITVTTDQDVVDGDTSSVSNLQGSQGTDNLISLREAILAVNAGAGGDTILLDAETYTLALTGEDTTGHLGDLDLLKSVTITGTGARSTIVDGGGIDRIFHTQNSSTIVNLSGVTIQGGAESQNGGGIYVDDDSTLNLTDVALLNNDGDSASGNGNGGAIHVHGTLNANRVIFSGNTAISGAAIYFHNAVGGTLTNVTISGNTATSQGGGIYTDTAITVTNSTITNNHADDGGGIRTDGGIVTILNTIVAGNTANSANADVLGTFVSNGFNLVEVLNGATGFDDDITGVSAGLGALSNNGGQTDSHALLASSAALNAGGNSDAETQDQVGNDRDSIPDIGAFESALESSKIYWADQGSDSIYRSNGDGTAIQKIADGLGGPSGLEIDLDGGKLYWIETDTNSLHSSNLDGSGITALNTTDLVNPTGLGLDLINGYLYVADDGNGVDDAIHRFDLDGNNFTTIVTHLGGVIGDVAVDGVAGRIYFTSHDNGSFDGSIQSVDTSGGTASTLATSLVGPRSLVIDQAADRLYYTDDGDFTFNYVVSIRLSDGGDAQIIENTGLDQPHGIAVDPSAEKAYWSDANNGEIYRSNLDGSGSETILSGLSSPQEIVVVSLSGESVNNAPTISDATLASVNEDATTPAGDTITNLFGGTFSDVDNSSSMTGVVVVGNGANPTTEGAWQYSSDSTNWFDIGTVDDSGNGLLVSVSSKIRFLPAADFNGIPTALVVRAVDDTFGGTFSTTSGSESRQTADTSSLTSSSAFSNATNTLGTSITAINDLPTIGGAADGTIDDNATTQPFAAVTITDVDGDNVSVSITVSNGDTNGVFTSASLTASGFSKSGSGQYTLISGSAAAAQSAVRQLVFDPTENQVTPGSTVVTNFTISVDDTNPAVVDSTTDITVTSINDAPVIGGTVPSQAIDDKQTATPLSTVTFSDNENDSITVLVTLSGGDANGQFTNASLTSSGFTKTDIGEYSLALSTTASAQTAIRGLVFAPTQNQVAVGSTVVTTFQITVDDGSTANDSSTTVTVTSANDVATDITLSNASVPENASGATVGTVNAVDPDTGDTHSWTVDDARFEITGTTLKLKAGQSLDMETEPSITLSITTTDQAGVGLNFSKSFTIAVDNANEAATDITLSNTSVSENAVGATVGTVGVADPDAGDTHTWAVNDTRFEIVGTTLKLKAGQSLDQEAEPTVSVTLTATDQAGAGLGYSESFTITVTPAKIRIPIVPVGGGGTTDPPPTESRESDNVDEEQPGEADTSERASEEENNSSNEESDTTTATGNTGIAPGTFSENLSAAAVVASSIDLTDAKQNADADGKASLDSMFTNSILDASSAIGSSLSIATNTTLDRVAGGLIRYGLQTTSLAASQANLAMMMKPGEMWSELDQQMQGIESQIQGDLIIVGAAGAATSSFMVGVAAWGLRTGFLASGLMAQLPAWRAVDPLLIMQGSGDGDNESLEDLMKRRSEELDELDASEHSVGEAIS